jgi:hypothetical protein
VPRVIIRRRSGRQQTKSLTAAAQRVDAKNPSSFRKSMTSGDGWQGDAWRYLELVGELQYVVSWRAWSASRCRLVASAMDDQGAPMGDIPEDDPNAEKVREIVRDIGGGVSGQAKMIHRCGYLLSVVGECWVGMVVRDKAREETIDGLALPVDISRPGYQLEQWYVFGKEQIQSTPSGVILKLPDGSKHEFNQDVDILFRVWTEHPMDPSKPVSPIWSNRKVLEGIIQADATIAAANNNRLVGNGIMFVPQEMSLPQQQAPVAMPVGTADTNDPVPFFEPNSAQALTDLLYDVASVAKRDPESQAAMLPIIAAVPGEMIKNVNWIRPGSDIPETTLKIQQEDIRRLAMGLDVAPERLFGMSEGNHWSAWAIDENDIKVHVAPLVQTITDALTQEILREKLVQEGIDPDQYIVWYDTTALSQDPDKTDEARDAFDRGAITAAALRQHFGFDDEDGYDYGTVDGWVQMALDKMAANPANTAQLLPILEAAARKVGLDIAPPPPPALAPGTDPNAQPGDGQNTDQQPPEPASAPKPEPAPIQAAGLTIARVCVNRALELANKRRRTRTTAALYREVPIQLAHTVLPPVRNGEAADLIKGWDTGVCDDDLVTLGLCPESFRSMVEGVAQLAQVTASAPVITQSMLRRL